MKMIVDRAMFIVIVTVLFAAAVASADEVIVCTDGCFDDAVALLSNGEAASSADRVGDRFAVVAPVAGHTITPIEMAPRLDTMEGKTIAVVGGSFMAQVTHPEIRRLIRANYPTARVILLNEIGSAGAYPPPGVNRRDTDGFKHRLVEMGVDAVISGNGGCGLCTPKETGSSIAAEMLGIPAVTIAAPSFVEQVRSTARNHGVTVPRTATYPGPFASHSREELLRNTREVLWPQIVAALTEPITSEEIEEGHRVTESSMNVTVFEGSIDEINHYFAQMRWSDGLPITPPTVDRVNEFLRYTDLPWDETVAVLPIAYRDITVWHVAVNGVMSGSPPEFMPLLIAYTQTLGNANARRSLSSTHGWVPYAWVNGPIGRQLGFDSGQGMISGVSNAQLGRFINLAMLNLGGYYVNENRMGSFGYLMPWTMAEDEEAAARVGWEPYHVSQGFGRNDNTITGGSALMWGNNLTPATPDPERIMQLMAWDVVEKSQFAVGSGMPFTYRTILITEHVARDLAARYPSKQALESALIETARRPVYERAFASYWASPGSAYDPARYTLSQHVARIMEEENASMTDPMPWSSEMDRIPTVPAMRPRMTPILIAGDPDRNKVLTMPGGGYATIKIELPVDWDALMADLGYPPLEEFFLE